jgi:hypothetical protein
VTIRWLIVALAVLSATPTAAARPSESNYFCEAEFADGNISAKSRLAVAPTTGAIVEYGSLNEWNWYGPNYPFAPSTSMGAFVGRLDRIGTEDVGFYVSIPTKPRSKVVRVELRFPTPKDAATDPAFWDEATKSRDTFYGMRVESAALVSLINGRVPAWLTLVSSDGSVIQALPVDLQSIPRGRSLLHKAMAQTLESAAEWKEKCGQEILLIEPPRDD